MNEDDAKVYLEWQKSPLPFIAAMWGLIAQPRREEFLDIPWRDTEEEHFHTFKKGKHVTWQQWKILKGIEEAVQGKASPMISIAAGRGIGKSCLLSWIIIWYLYVHVDCQVPCTAPSADQMYDVLWKEIAKWLSKMPKPEQERFEWQRSYLRMTEKPAVWFARARTARKEAPEAMVGIHADHVLAVVDEASGVDDVIFQAGEGTFTNKHILMIMVSNPRRLIGYFHESHHRLRHQWQCFQFDSRESPVVDNQFVARMVENYGEDSDQYRIEVIGQFPTEDAVDDKGYVPLLLKSDLRQIPSSEFVSDIYMGVDPSGEGDDETVWVIRDRFKAKVARKEKVSDPQGIALQTAELMDYYEIIPSNVYVDNFGVGANVAVHLAQVGKNVNGVNVGEMADDTETFINKRAESYWRIKQWFRDGGELVSHSGWDELLTIRYRPNLKSKIQIMGKHEMRREGYRSPNIADALMLTFAEEIVSYQQENPVYDVTESNPLG